jgi:serine phosphatase RsbU (regulator of sigma subunit)
MIEKDKLWFGSNLSGLGCIEISGNKTKILPLGENNGLQGTTNNSVFTVNEEILVGTNDGIYRKVESNQGTSFEPDTSLNRYLPNGNNKILKIYEDPESNIWMSFENSITGWMIGLLEANADNDSWNPLFKPFFIFENNFSTDAFHSLDGEDAWFSISNVLYHFDRNKKFSEGGFKTLIRKVTVDDDTVIYNGAYPILSRKGDYILGFQQDPQMVPNLKYSENNIEFRWSSPYYEYEDKIEYSYFLEGFSKFWSEWEHVLYQDFTNLPQGTYTLRVKARNIYQDESSEDSFSFTILRPWYLTFVAFLVYIIVAVFIVYIIIVLYTRRLKNENIRLEGIIQERTAEIRKQKEELTDSIEYASRIQRAVLPPDQILKNQDFEHFILFRPRDIVSGDFYWFGKNNGKIFIVAADCTGHGVPGAFMSMLGITFLDEIVIKSGISETNQILDALRNHVITSLRQTGKSIDESTKDGMDLAMVAIDESTKTIQFSGAYNPLYAVRLLTEKEKQQIKSGELIDQDRGTIYNDTHLLYQVKADHMPIGISEKTNNFSSEIIQESDVTIYLFSDGYVDQFGGPSGKKFMSKNFKKLLLDIQGLSMEQQRNKLNEELIAWMGDVSQIDDILVIGIKINAD